MLYSTPLFERPPLNPTKIGLTREMEVTLYSKYNLNEKCGLSRGDYRTFIMLLQRVSVA